MSFVDLHEKNLPWFSKDVPVLLPLVDQFLDEWIKERTPLLTSLSDSIFSLQGDHWTRQFTSAEEIRT